MQAEWVGAFIFWHSLLAECVCVRSFLYSFQPSFDVLDAQTFELNRAILTKLLLLFLVLDGAPIVGGACGGACGGAEAACACCRLRDADTNAADYLV